MTLFIILQSWKCGDERMYEITTDNNPFKIVIPSQILPFTRNLHDWYSNQDSLPNIFTIFEYPDFYGDAIIRSMINFHAQKIYSEENISLSNAIHKAIEHYNGQTPFINACLEDVRTGLDIYHLSYQYKEMNARPIYYNLHTKGVW